MKKYIPKWVAQIAKKVLFPSTPSHLKKRQIQIDDNKLRLIEQSIRKNYHTGWRSESNYSKEMYEHDLQAHLYKRLERDRVVIVPFLNNVRSLDGSRILEIGCGTGSSTVALTEQGAKVTGIDIDEGALNVAKDRADAYGISAELLVLNSIDIADAFGANAFDFIIFFACLEHMTITERLLSLKDAWDALPNSGLLVIIETPNRLWYLDNHTSRLPFFHWLPNELAFKYSSFSPRENFRELYKDYDADSKEHFLRRGRGVSFHELDLAIGPTKNLNVLSSLSEFQGIGYRLQQSRLSKQYKFILKNIYPDIHQGFFDDSLYLIIEKNNEKQAETV